MQYQCSFYLVGFAIFNLTRKFSVHCIFISDSNNDRIDESELWAQIIDNEVEYQLILYDDSFENIIYYYYYYFMEIWCKFSWLVKSSIPRWMNEYCSYGYTTGYVSVTIIFSEIREIC